MIDTMIFIAGVWLGFGLGCLYMVFTLKPDRPRRQ
jgi:hypothetical protein